MTLDLLNSIPKDSEAYMVIQEFIFHSLLKDLFHCSRKLTDDLIFMELDSMLFMCVSSIAVQMSKEQMTEVASCLQNIYGAGNSVVLEYSITNSS